jgi:hypothetical protein
LHLGGLEGGGGAHGLLSEGNIHYCPKPLVNCSSNPALTHWCSGQWRNGARHPVKWFIQRGNPGKVSDRIFRNTMQWYRIQSHHSLEPGERFPASYYTKMDFWPKGGTACFRSPFLPTSPHQINSNCIDLIKMNMYTHGHGWELRKDVFRDLNT